MMERLAKGTPGIAIVVLILFSTVAAGCSNSSAQVNSGLELAPLADLPTEVQEAPVTVQEAYQFAVANPDILTQIPCYCGCGSMGHTSNYACFVAGENGEGTVTIEEHALGCSICVDIAQDTMRLLNEGKSVDEIFAYVDNNYSRFGPPTPLEP